MSHDEAQPPRPALTLIAAVARNGAIGRDGDLLWREAADQRHFRTLTTGYPVIMGRKTWDSIGRPLPGRRNIVVTRNPAWQAEGAEAAPSLDAALALTAGGTQRFVIGGAEIYALALPFATELLLTEIDADYDADAFFPAWRREHFAAVGTEAQTTAEGLGFRYVTYRRTRPS